MSNERCIGCGLVFTEGDSTREIYKSKYPSNSGTEKSAPSKLYGVLHEDCFDRGVTVPSIVMDRIKKLGKAHKKSA